MRNNPSSTPKWENTEITNEINNHEQTLRSFALKLTGNQADADDLYQETVLKIRINRQKYIPNTNFKAWSATIMRNIFINDYRKKRIRREWWVKTESAYDKIVEIDTEKTSTEWEWESNLVVEEITDVISTLNPKYREPFLLRTQWYSYKEIAREMDLPVGTVKSKLHTARIQLQEALSLMYPEKAKIAEERKWKSLYT